MHLTLTFQPSKLAETERSLPAHLSIVLSEFSCPFLSFFLPLSGVALALQLFGGISQKLLPNKRIKFPADGDGNGNPLELFISLLFR